MIVTAIRDRIWKFDNSCVLSDTFTVYVKQREILSLYIAFSFNRENRSRKTKLKVRVPEKYFIKHAEAATCICDM